MVRSPHYQRLPILHMYAQPPLPPVLTVLGLSFLPLNTLDCFLFCPLCNAGNIHPINARISSEYSANLKLRIFCVSVNPWQLLRNVITCNLDSSRIYLVISAHMNFCLFTHRKSPSV